MQLCLGVFLFFLLTFVKEKASGREGIKSWSLHIFINYFCERQNRIMDECAGNKFMKMRNLFFYSSSSSSSVNVEKEKRRWSRHKRDAIIPSSLYLYTYPSMIFRKSELSPSEKHCRHLPDVFLVLAWRKLFRAFLSLSLLLASSPTLVRSSGKMNENFQWIWSMKFQTILKLKYDFSCLIVFLERNKTLDIIIFQPT